MMYIEVRDDVIQSLYCGPVLPTGGDYREVPEDFAGTGGQSVKEFDENWKLLPLNVRLERGLIPEAKRYKNVGGFLEPKTFEELVRDGVESAPEGTKLDPAAPFDRPRLMGLTRAEMVAAGLMTEAKAIELDMLDEEALLLERLAVSDWYSIRASEGGPAIPDNIKASRNEARARISAIRGEIEKLHNAEAPNNGITPSAQ